MSTILVTGGSGLIGSQFSTNAIKLSSRDGDLRDTTIANSLFEKYKNVDGVIHCAAKVGGIKGNMNHKGEFFYDNVMINTNVIEAARKVGINKLVCFLSTCIFPDSVEYPLTVNKIHMGEPHISNYPYAYSKRMADIQIRSYREQYGLQYTSVIPTNIYGPNDNFDIENGHVIPSLIHKCYLAHKNKTDLEVWGTGKAMREFIYSKDVAQLSEWILNNYTDPEPIILSTSYEISIKELVDLIVDIFNFKGNVIWRSDQPEGQFRKPSDNSKIKNLLPGFQFTTIQKGLQETIEWFITNYDISRK